MENNITIIPTNVPQTRQSLFDATQIVSLFTDALHIDINDGVFAHPRTWPVLPEGAYESIVLPPIETHIHLMVEDIKTYGDMFASAGVHTVIVHAESYGALELLPQLMVAWKKKGVSQVGIAVQLGADVRDLIRHTTFGIVDFVLCMSVAHIGEQGSLFDTRVIENIRTFSHMCPDKEIAVDGGITAINIESLVTAGARRFYIGSSIMRSVNPKDSYEQLLAIAKSALQ